MEKDREKMQYAYGVEMPPASAPERPSHARSCHAQDPYANVEPLPESSRPRRDGPGGEDGEPDTENPSTSR